MNMFSGILSLSLGVVMFAGVFMYILHNTSTSGWSTTEITLWSMLGLVGVGGMAYGVMSVFGLGGQ